MMTIRRSNERGHANHGWLDSHHTFSFANYFDPEHMSFGPLRVINQDVVAAGRGFGTHPHQSMEIISYVLRGTLGHKDTLGTNGVIRPGEVQRMSAGSGIRHSEMNASATEDVSFLQIWIVPRASGGPASYAQADFGLDPGLRLIMSPEGRDGSLTMNQDVDLWRWLAPHGTTAELGLRHRKAWVQVVRGAVHLGDQVLQPGDGAALTDVPTLQLTADGDVEALLFDLP